ncbi:MAG: glycosyltransferase family 4 protein [Desulfobulbaceae bacterium]
MRIAFYAPFKPIDHPNPSGDRIIGAGLVEYLCKGGDEVEIASRLRGRWLYWKPWQLVRLAGERRRVTRALENRPADLWLTYHSYYKAPDMLGPQVSRRLNIPYVIFQGIYSTKVRRDWRTRPGYHLNTRALLAANLVLTNRQDDLLNLRRLLPEERLAYLRPGIHPAAFTADPEARQRLRGRWRAGDTPVLLSAAMFRPDVKSQGLQWVIESCSRLVAGGHDLRLVIAGDGRERHRLEESARRLLGERVIFTGRIPRDEMASFYSAGDLFLFPGINESLGMVFLEAQSCGLPVVAFDTAGVPEVVRNGETGLLTPAFDSNAFDRAVRSLLDEPEKRLQMGRAAAAHIRSRHDLEKNYPQLAELLRNVVEHHRRVSR